MSSSSSLPREKTDEICQNIKANPDSLFGQKYWQCRLACTVQIQQKADKWDTRFLAIAKFRVFLLNGKSVSGLKVERSFNILALRHLELDQQEQILQIGWEDRPGGARQSSSATVVHLFVRMPDGGRTRELALEFFGTLKHYFPEIQKSLSKLLTTVGPPSLLSEFPTLPVSTPELPCHNFRRSYVAYCDWMEQPFRDEVIWDIERIYFFHNQHELDLNDFSHLTLKDQQALIGAIQYSDFFTGLSADGLRLHMEHIEALFQLLRRSHSLKSLQLTRCLVPKDFLQQFATALVLNPNLPLERLRLAGIALDDRKGLAQLATLLPQMPCLQSLSLPDCSLSEKSVLALLHGIHHGIGMAKDSAQSEDADGAVQMTREQKQQSCFQLKLLNLSGNPLGNGTELCEQMANLLALNNGAMRLLDLSGTALQLDRLLAALKLGGIGLEVLRLGNCHLAPQRRRSSGNKDSSQVARELFLGLRALKELNFAGTQLNADVLHGILAGLASNPNLPHSSLDIFLDNCIVGSSSCMAVLEQHLPACSSIRALSLRDNAMENETFRLLSAIGQMSGIRQLDIGGANFTGLKANKKHAQILIGILTELVKLINDTGNIFNSHIEELSLSDSKLGSHLSILLNALGLTKTLARLDLSNCELGPGGARLLGKSLQLNHSLRYLSLDRNQIGPDGFLELARALRLNTTLLRLQLSTVDLTESMMALARLPAERARLMLVMAEIEAGIERNCQMAKDKPTNEQMALRTIHSLNNACDRYDVNGTNASEVKKVAFHKIGKLVTQLGDDEDANVGTDFLVNGDKQARLVENLAESVENMAAESAMHFLQKFTERLSTHEGVEIKMDPPDEQKLNNGFPSTAKEQLGERLRHDLDALVERYKREFVWNQLFTQMDRLLCAPESQKCFNILEKLSIKSGGTPNRRGILIRNGNNASPMAAVAPMSVFNHRPVSAMIVGEDPHTVAAYQLRNGTMSRSVMGDFAPNGDGLAEEDEEQQESDKLVHLAKQRPKPARMNRRKQHIGVGGPRSGIKMIEEEEPANEGNPTKTSASILPPTFESSNHSPSLELSLEQSPVMQKQRQKHRQWEEKEEDSNSSPPKLPPKPSPNAEELRSKRVLQPAGMDVE